MKDVGWFHSFKSVHLITNESLQYACGTWLNKQIWPPSWAILTFVYIFACFSFRLSGIRARPVLNERL